MPTCIFGYCVARERSDRADTGGFQGAKPPEASGFEGFFKAQMWHF